MKYKNLIIIIYNKMSDAEYEIEADYYPESAEESEELESEESEESETEKEDENKDNIDYLEEPGEIEKEKKEELFFEKLNEKDKNHIIYKIIPKDKRRSSNIIQFSEMVEAIGIRISQIEMGSPVFTDTTGLNNVFDMAKKEFFDRKNPLIIERKMKESSNIVEIEEWPVREMTFPITELSYRQ